MPALQTLSTIIQPSQEPMPQPSKFGGFPPNPVGLFIIGFLLNAAWCIGWALFLLSTLVRADAGRMTPANGRYFPLTVVTRSSR